MADDVRMANGSTIAVGPAAEGDKLRGQGMSDEKPRGATSLTQELNRMARDLYGIRPVPPQALSHKEVDPAEARALASTAASLLEANRHICSETLGEVAELILKRAKALLG